MIIATNKFDNCICVSRFIKTTEEGEYMLDFNAITLDGKLRESVTKLVSEHYVCARLNTCRKNGGTLAVIKSGKVTYKCEY